MSFPSSPVFDFDLCMHKDRFAVAKELRKLNGLDEELREHRFQKLKARYKASCELRNARARHGLNISYPESLPVSQRVEDIKAAIESHQVVVVAGETGSGKTTQLPKVCVELGLGDAGLIGHTQPRRLAARTVSNRIAEELNVALGEQVGYQVRYSDNSSPNTLVKVMTDGILLSEIKSDPYLNKYRVLIIDEAHERSLNIDFILGYLKTLLPRRPDLKLLITSATIDVERFSSHFNNAPVIDVEGRSFPVDVQYLAEGNSSDFNEISLPEQVEIAINSLLEDERSRKWGIGDILVFLPGEREIREVAKHLRYADWRDTEITPLYARLSNEDQAKIFKPHRGRRVVLATNVAETSITVPGIRYVIDSGVARVSRYSVRSKIQRLPVENISQASANQRKGRCGRVAEGICYRLYSEDDFESRPMYTDPEILRTNLASVVLKMLDAGLGDVKRFPFIDMPESKLWNDGYKLLFELGAVNEQRRITKIGRELARLPIDPKLGRALFEAKKRSCLSEALIVISGLSVQDPRERPVEKKQAADQAHSAYKDKDSDFVSYLKLFLSYEDQRQALGSSALKRYTQKSFLSYMRMREWRELHRQLVLATKEWGEKPAPPNADKITSDGLSEDIYQNLHISILSGFLSNVARHEEKREYLGCRNKKLQMFPGSGLAKSKTKWIVSSEIVETQEVFARVNARIDPAWIEGLAPHLVKKSWSEPHFSSKRGQVLAYEKVTLYGLEVVSRRLVNFGQIDPVVAREVFIRSALVEGQYRGKLKVIQSNYALLSELEKIEDRTRRRDVVIDDEALYGLYDKAIPNSVMSEPTLEKWFRQAGAQEKAALEFKPDQLSLDDAANFDSAQYPDTLENNGIKFPLSYSFSPGAEHDGVSVSVPARAIRQITAARIEKLVPGLLLEKCTQLIKNLPRTLRKHFVPVPDTVKKIYSRVESSNEPLLETLTRELKFISSVEVPLDAWNIELLDPHLRLNIKLLDDKGETLAQSRDLLSLVDQADNYLKDRPQEQVTSAKSDDREYISWDFVLEDAKDITQSGITLKVFPAIIDKQRFVKISEEADEQKAKRESSLAFARLLSFRLKDQISMLAKVVPKYKELGLYYAPVGQSAALYDDFVIASISQHFECGIVVKTEQEFEQRLEARRGDYVEHCIKFAALVHEILAQYHTLMKALKGKVQLDVAMSVSDLKHQLDNLVYDRFLSSTPAGFLEHYPRYLKAASIRHEKMAREQALERQSLPKLKQWWDDYNGRLEQHNAQGIYDPELERFRWLIEEQRVSWFAQQLGTNETVSEKRLNKQWQLVRRV